MTEDFETQALNYLLDELDASQREAFERQIASQPSARVEFDRLTDSLRMLRRQARDLAFFGGPVRRPSPRFLTPLRRGVEKFRQLVA